MSEISGRVIQETVKRLFIEANFFIGKDISDRIQECMLKEASPVGKAVLAQLLENYKLAACEHAVICSETGMAVVFAEIGRKVIITDSPFYEAINNGISKACLEGSFQRVMVSDPLFSRLNTDDNSPAVIHTSIVEGDRINITVAPRCILTESSNAFKMLSPEDGIRGVSDFVISTVFSAGKAACPPMIIGVGIGGNFEKTALLAKKASIRPIDTRNCDSRYAALEFELIEKINRLGLGPAGTGGKTTALAVNIEHSPTHVSGLPVAVNIGCHAARRAHAEIWQGGISFCNWRR